MMSYNDLPQGCPEVLDVRSMTRRSLLRRAAGVMATAQIAGMLLAGTLAAQENVKENADPKPADSGQKTVYISFLLHGNMCYDRYTKQEIREKFPGIYATGVRAMHKHPDVTAHIDFPGLTVLSIKYYAPWFLDELKPLVNRKQVVMVGCEYAANHPMCADEEAEWLAGRVTMEILRRELQPDVSTFIAQEIAFHPQMPYIMNQIGAKRLIAKPDGWQRPRRVRGVDGNSLIVYPLNGEVVKAAQLEHYYDTHPDGSFVMGGGDFEMLGNIEAYVAEIKRLAAKGKIIKWTTVDRYEKEIGIHEECVAPHPFGHRVVEEREASPSFSRWVGRPDDMIWHEHAVRAMDAIRTAGFAKVAAAVHKLGPVDVPLEQAWTAEPDNPWDTRFEFVDEFPETELHYLTNDGVSTILSRAWHHLLIGLNSDASGWVPWTPRTRHRNQVLDTSRALSHEAVERFARQVASRIRKPKPAANGYALAVNPAQARTAEIVFETEGPFTFVDADGKRIPTAVSLRDGRWSATARVDLPSYGYKLLGLMPTADVTKEPWTTGDKVAFSGRSASLADGRLTVGEGQNQLAVALAPFKLSDPSRVAETETVTPDWTRATTRVRQTAFGPDLEIFTELAWAVWTRLVIGLREGRIDVTAEVHVDMPRRIGNLGFDPRGLLLEFKGDAGRVFYDVPYATIEHINPEPSFIAVQRFAAMDSGAASFAVVALGGNQSFHVSPKQGVLAASLGASLRGRCDTRPQCTIRPDGYAVHKTTAGGDPLLGSYEHRFSLLFRRPAEAAVLAHELRTASPVVRVEVGDGDWPAEQSLLNITPASARLTAFRSDRDGNSIVANDVAGEPCRFECQGQSVAMPAFSSATVRVSP